MQIFNLKNQYKIKRIAGVWYMSINNGATVFNFPTLDRTFEVFSIWEPLSNTIN